MYRRSKWTRRDPYYYQLSRRERGDLIPDDAVEVCHKDCWQVQSQSDSGFHDEYEVKKTECLRRRCANADPCHHMYSCDCPDDVNPCKHIYKVHSMVQNGDFDSDSDDDDDDDDDHVDALPGPPFTPERRQQLLTADVADISNMLNELQGIITNTQFSIDMSGELKGSLQGILSRTKSELALPVRY